MAQKPPTHNKVVVGNRSSNLSDVDVVILAGGLGKRLRSLVSDRPKVLAEVGQRPFLDILINYLRNTGFSRIILSIGYLKDQIKERYANQGILFAEEETPLGTGGGIKNAQELIRSKNFFVMNGDSWIPSGVNMNMIHNFHKDKKALATVVLSSPRIQKDYGVVFLDKENLISHFNEKSKEEGTHFLNAGIYLLNQELFSRMSQTPFSLESDFFPSLIGEAFYGFPIEGEVVDIGTPERYVEAQQKFSGDK